MDKLEVLRAKLNYYQLWIHITLTSIILFTIGYWLDVVELNKDIFFWIIAVVCAVFFVILVHYERKYRELISRLKKGR